MNDIPETAFCHRCQQDTPTRIMSLRDGVALNVCRICRAARKGRPNVPYAMYEQWKRTHVLTDAEINYTTNDERRRIRRRAEMDRQTGAGGKT